MMVMLNKICIDNLTLKTDFESILGDLTLLKKKINTILAYPIDSIILYFSKLCNKAFKYKLKEDTNIKSYPLIAGADKTYVYYPLITDKNTFNNFYDLKPSNDTKTNLFKSFILDLDIYIKQFNDLGSDYNEIKINNKEYFCALFAECNKLINNQIVRPVHLFIELVKKGCCKQIALWLVHKYNGIKELKLTQHNTRDKNDTYLFNEKNEPKKTELYIQLAKELNVSKPTIRSDKKTIKKFMINLMKFKK
jgi:hypothetical protein